jgi:hypothetical protein
MKYWLKQIQRDISDLLKRDGCCVWYCDSWAAPDIESNGMLSRRMSTKSHLLGSEFTASSKQESNEPCRTACDR